jgi:hypothetical protein
MSETGTISEVGPMERLETLVYAIRKFLEVPHHNDAAHGYRFGMAFHDLERETEETEAYIKERDAVIAEHAEARRNHKPSAALTEKQLDMIAVDIERIKQRRGPGV